MQLKYCWFGNLQINWDKVDLFSTRINPFIGIPYNKRFTVIGIYELEILDYDQKYIFTDYQFLNDFLENAGKVFYLNELLSLSEKKNILKNTPNVEIKNWDSDHYSFISAMKVEKIIYSLVGILIIGISNGSIEIHFEILRSNEDDIN